MWSSSFGSSQESVFHAYGISWVTSFIFVFAESYPFLWNETVIQKRCLDFQLLLISGFIVAGVAIILDGYF